MTTFLIVTPSYNQAAFLKETIESVLSQKGEFEVVYVVIDGASSDGSVELLKSFGKKLLWLSEPDNGQTEAINKGLQLLQKKVIGQAKTLGFGQNTAKHQYIVAYLNSDDYYLSGALQQVATAYPHQ